MRGSMFLMLGLLVKGCGRGDEAALRDAVKGATYQLVAGSTNTGYRTVVGLLANS